MSDQAGPSRHFFDEDGTLRAASLTTNTDQEKARAARYVASSATNKDDAALLLALLGLSPRDGLTAPRSTDNDDLNDDLEASCA